MMLGSATLAPPAYDPFTISVSVSYFMTPVPIIQIGQDNPLLETLSKPILLGSYPLKRAWS